MANIKKLNYEGVEYALGINNLVDSAHDGLMSKEDKVQFDDIVNILPDDPSKLATLVQLVAGLDRKIEKGSLATINGHDLEKEVDIHLDLSVYKIVNELPTEDDNIDGSKIYVVKNLVDGVPTNLWDEWMWVNSAWEKVGSFRAEVDLAPYQTIEQHDKDVEQINNTIEANKNASDTAISNLNTKVNQDITNLNNFKNTVAETYETKEAAETSHNTLLSKINENRDNHQTDVANLTTAINNEVTRAIAAEKAINDELKNVVHSTTIKNEQVMTTAQFNALDEIDNDTLYIIY